MKELCHILSLLPESVAIPVKMGSNFAHNSVENVSKLSLSYSSFILDNNITAQLLASLASLLEVSNDGSNRICSITFVINLGPVVMNKVHVYQMFNYYFASNLELAYHKETCCKQPSFTKPQAKQASLHNYAQQI